MKDDETQVLFFWFCLLLTLAGTGATPIVFLLSRLYLLSACTARHSAKLCGNKSKLKLISDHRDVIACCVRHAITFLGTFNSV